MARPGPKGVSFAEFRTIDAVDPIAVALQRACGPETPLGHLLAKLLILRHLLIWTLSDRFKTFQIVSVTWPIIMSLILS
jgi:hypothetical protein